MAVGPQQKGGMVHRFTIFVFFFAVLIGVLVVRLWLLQIVQGQRYEALASGNRIREVSLEAQRGYILDRNGTKMVVNRLALSIFIVPDDYQKLEDKEQKVAELALLLDMSSDEITAKLEGNQVPQHEPVLIEKDIEPEVWFYIAERQQDFTWVQAKELPVRDYPLGEETRAAHVLGYLGEISEDQLGELAEKGYKAGDIVGTSGAEAYYEDVLRGINGVSCVEVNARGKPLRTLEYLSREPEPGNTLMLTVDRNLQQVAEESLQAGMQLARSFYDAERGWNYPATAGAVVVLDPRNGEVLAMVSEPTYNLSEFVGGISEQKWEELQSDENNYPLNNRAIVGEYPPGSTFKSITAMAAMEELGYTAYSPFYCKHVFDEGEFKGEAKRTCWGTHGSIDLLNGIIQSCDTVFYKMGYDLYRQSKPSGDSSSGGGEWRNILQDYARLAGLGTSTGIDLPYEHAGRVPTPQWKREYNEKNPDYQQWNPGDTVSMAIGQGDILVTPLQLANIYAAIANRGPFYRPHVGKEIFSWDGVSKQVIQPEKIGDITDTNNPLGISVSAESIDVNRAGLEGVVRGKGTAASTFAGFPLDSIPVAGKTGTAEMGIDKSPTAWFACYAPADNPQYVIVVTIEYGGHGGTVAAPVARRILESIYGLPISPLSPSTGD